MAGVEHPNATIPDNVEVPRVGMLWYELGFPTPETSRKLFAEMACQRAVRPALWGWPAVTFESVRATVKRALGIGVKVATLPVIALGVGIGIDYALYLLSVQLAQQRLGVSLAEAYRRTLQFTGKVVVLVGVTLAAGVITWALSPIKFQADMGILLAFMFIWNMVGAIVLIPALSHFLLPSGSRAPLHRPSKQGPSPRTDKDDHLARADYMHAV